MTLNEIINLTPDKLNKLTAAELRPLIQQMNSAANKQIKRLEASELGSTSPALNELKRSGGTALTTRGKTLNEMRAEFARGKNFFTNKTRTVGGTKDYRENIRKGLKEAANVDIEDLSNKQVGKVFKALHQFKEKYPAFYSPEVLNKIVNATSQFKDKRRITPERLMEIVEQDLMTEYEEDEAEYSAAFDEDDFIEWGF